MLSDNDDFKVLGGSSISLTLMPNHPSTELLRLFPLRTGHSKIPKIDLEFYEEPKNRTRLCLTDDGIVNDLPREILVHASAVSETFARLTIVPNPS